MDERLLEGGAEDLFEHAPCGYLLTDPSGLIIKVNETFLDWTGYEREELVGSRRFSDLLNPAGRIYHETHYAPLLQMQGAVRAIALELVRADKTQLAALVNSTVHTDDAGRPQQIRTTIFDATDRRRYEQELLQERRHEQQIALQLQRSMLSGSLPSDPRFELAVEYHPAGDGLEIGGDWYDAFWLDEDSRLALVVGDVVGRGIGAAATMGQLRSAVRALAATGLRPAELLHALDHFAATHEIGQSTTLVCSELDLETGELSWACAGHPPPLFATAGAEPAYSTEGLSFPVDSFIGEAPPRAEGRKILEPGDLVLLYTDGLVERRNALIDDGMNDLVEQVRMSQADTPENLVKSVFTALRDDRHPDDVCLLALRFGSA